MSDDNMILGYLMGQETGKSNGMFGGGGIYDLLALGLVFGDGFGGFGGGFGGGGAGLQGIATRADINEGFALNNITGGITAIQQGICDSTYALNNAVTGGFNGLSAQMAQCCCDNRAAIADVKYDLASQFCALGNTIQNTTRDIIDNQNANYRGLMDFMVSEKLAGKDAQIAALTNQLSQANQNAVIGARIDAAVAEVLRRTGNDCPTPAYWVNPPTPVQVPYGWGQRGGSCGDCGY